MTDLEVVDVFSYSEFEVTGGIEAGGRQTNPVLPVIPSLHDRQTPFDNRMNFVMIRRTGSN